MKCASSRSLRLPSPFGDSVPSCSASSLGPQSSPEGGRTAPLVRPRTAGPWAMGGRREGRVTAVHSFNQ